MLNFNSRETKCPFPPPPYMRSSRQKRTMFPTKRVGCQGEEWEKETAAIVPLCFFLDWTTAWRHSEGAGVKGFLISQLVLLISCQGPVGWAALCHCRLASQGEDGRAGGSDRCSEPAPAHWVIPEGQEGQQL